MSLFDQAYLAPDVDYSKNTDYIPDQDVLALTPAQRRNALVRVLKSDSHPADSQAPLVSFLPVFKPSGSLTYGSCILSDAFEGFLVDWVSIHFLGVV